MSSDESKSIASNALPSKDPDLPSQRAQQEIVTVLVGVEKTAFRLPKDFLRSKALYFETSLKDCWNGSTNEIFLNDVRKPVFEVFVEYLFMGKIPPYFVKEHNELKLKDDFIALYKFADDYMHFRMKNDLVDVDLISLRKNRGYWTLDGLIKICNAGLTHTPLYQLALTSSATAMIDNESWEELEPKIGSLLEYRDVVKDVFRSILKHKKGHLKKQEDGNPCLFHDHADGSSCTPESITKRQ